MKIPVKTIEVDQNEMEPIEAAMMLPIITVQRVKPMDYRGRVVMRREFIDFYYDRRLGEMRLLENTMNRNVLSEEEIALMEALLQRLESDGEIDHFEPDGSY